MYSNFFIFKYNLFKNIFFNKLYKINESKRLLLYSFNNIVLKLLKKKII